MIQVDISNIWGALSLPDLLAVEKEVADAHGLLADSTGAEIAQEELRRVLDAAEKIRSDSDVCVVLGPEENCTGPQAAVELLQGCSRNLLKKPQVFFWGGSLSTRHWNELMALLEGRDFSVIVSGSGGALEPGITLRGLRWMLERKYGTDEASSRIYAIASREDSPLGRMAQEEQWMTVPLSGDAWPVLSPAGLLPMAVAGLDIEEVLKGAADAREKYSLHSFENPVWLYAGVRSALYRQGKGIELLECPEPGFRCFGRWWRQLFGSAGGIFPVPAEWAEDSSRDWQSLFETMVRFAPEEKQVQVCSDWKNLDDLGHLEGKTLAQVEEDAFQARVCARADDGVPVMVMECGVLTERTVGELLWFLGLCRDISACLRPGGAL